jgi:lipopolysaccharide transport system permease protein
MSTPVWVIQHSHSWGRLGLREVWDYRDLLYFLVWREVKIRYRQAALGVAWVVLQPLVTVLVFGLLFGRLLRVPSEGTPYPVFVLTALLPWSYFSGALARGAASLVSNSPLITKVYFPRLLVPLSAVLACLVDFLVSLVVLLGFMLHYDVVPGPGLLALPGLVLWETVVAFAFTLWLAALNVRYRDVQYVMPVLLQIWLYVTPVIYAISLVPERFRSLVALNPLTGVVESFRWAVLGINGPVALVSFWISLPLVTVVLVGGIVFFRGTERTFADVV